MNSPNWNLELSNMVVVFMTNVDRRISELPLGATFKVVVTQESNGVQVWIGCVETDVVVYVPVADGWFAKVNTADAVEFAVELANKTRRANENLPEECQE